MSTTRPEREEDAVQRLATPGRRPALRTTPVTGAAEVEAQIEMHLSQCRRRGGVLALVTISVDAVGRGPGEAVALLEQSARQEASNRIGNAVRGSDAILRESERDTVVVLFGADAAVAALVCRRLERLVGGDYQLAGERLQVVVRTGTAAQPGHGTRAPELLRRAGVRPA